MKIQSVNMSYNTAFCSKSKNKYENPVNRNTERNLAILATVGGSAIAGALSGWLTSSLMEKKNWKLPAAVGAAVGLVVLGLTLPQKLYNTKVNAFARQKEMDVFSRQKSAQSSIYEDIDSEVKDERVSLDQKINHYATVKMADNGSGVMVKGV